MIRILIFLSTAITIFTNSYSKTIKSEPFNFSGVSEQTPVYPSRDASMNLGSSSGDVLWFPYTPIKKSGSVFEMYYMWNGIKCYARSTTGKNWTFSGFVTTPSGESIVKKNNTWYMAYHTHIPGIVLFNTTISLDGILFPPGIPRFTSGEDMSLMINNDSFYCYIRPDAPAIDPRRKIGLMRSSNFTSWTPIQTILAIDSTEYEDINSPDFRMQYYNMSVFKVGADWWALANLYRIGDDEEDTEQLPPYGVNEQTMETHLLYSSDGINWIRTNDRNAFIPRTGATKQIYGLPTVDNNTLYIYTIESDRRHTDYDNDNIAGRWFSIWRYSISLNDLLTWKPGSKANVTLAVEGLLNNFSGLNITDTVTLLLRKSYAPYDPIDSIDAPLDSVSLSASFNIGNISTGSYYISIKGRNFLETWSKNPVQILQSQNISYDFTTSLQQAYGNNMISKNGTYCLYSGDLDQNGMIDLRDILITYNDAANLITGYQTSDVNGDLNVDLNDIILVNNNVNRFVKKISP